MKDFKDLSKQFVMENVKGNVMTIKLNQEYNSLIEDAYWYDYMGCAVSSITHEYMFKDNLLRVTKKLWKRSMGFYHIETRYLTPASIESVSFAPVSAVSYYLP